MVLFCCFGGFAGDPPPKVVKKWFKLVCRKAAVVLTGQKVVYNGLDGVIIWSKSGSNWLGPPRRAQSPNHFCGSCRRLSPHASQLWSVFSASGWPKREVDHTMTHVMTGALRLHISTTLGHASQRNMSQHNSRMCARAQRRFMDTGAADRTIVRMIVRPELGNRWRSGWRQVLPARPVAKSPMAPTGNWRCQAHRLVAAFSERQAWQYRAAPSPPCKRADI